MCVCVCAFRFFSCIFFLVLPFGPSEEDNAKLKPQRPKLLVSLLLISFFVWFVEGPAGPRLQTGERQELLRVYRDREA